jgi:pantetheine-phosphate adenylyltransferase
MAYNLLVCGGTFDHFHKGHKTFLKHVFSVGKKNLVGVTSDEFVQRWKIDGRSWKQIESFEKRKQAVLEFVKKEKALNKVEIVKIDDLFGPTLSKELLIDVIAVSEESKKGAEIINQKRKELGLNPLEILIAPFVQAEDGKIISSERIRNGEIDKNGRLYINPLWLREGLVLSENLRQEFKEPFGEILQDMDIKEASDSYIISVGDATTKKFNDNSVNQQVSVIDFKIARKEEYSSFSQLGFKGDEEIIGVNNPSGHITAELLQAIFQIFKSDFKNRVILKIIGEDDLAVLPLILFAPLGVSIYYGQPNKGLVKISISTEAKDRAYSLASKLRPI